MAANSRLRIVAEVASRAYPDTIYNVYEHRDTHALSCQCKGWVFAPTCHCGEKLFKHHEGDRRVFICPTHGRVPEGAPQPGKALRACPHIRRYLNGVAGDTAAVGTWQPSPYTAPPARQAARQRPTVTPGGQHDGPLVPLVLRAAKGAGLLDALTEWQWRRFAGQLAPLVDAGLPAAPEQSGLDLRPVRRIYLED